jgi:ERCC4-type nuclease
MESECRMALQSTGDHHSIHVPPANMQLAAYLQRQGQPSLAASPLFLEGIRRYPLPVLTAATATDVAGWGASLAQANSTASPDSAGCDERQSASAHLLHCFWRDANLLSLAVGSSEREASSPTMQALPSVPAERSTEVAEAASWLAHSPFRVCAQPSFHAQLRQWVALPAVGPTLGGTSRTPPSDAACRWRFVDALCHGLTTAEDRPSPRKRTRTRSVPSPAAAAPPPAQLPTVHHALTNPVPPDVVQPAAARGARTADNTHGRDMVAKASPTPSPALQSRVRENDDLLDMLLGVSATGASTPAGHDAVSTESGEASGQTAGLLAVETTRRLSSPDAVQSHTAAAHSTCASAALGCYTACSVGTASRAIGDEGGDVQRCLGAPCATGSEAVLARHTIKELKELCTRRGLLSTGSKSVLLRRLQLYESPLTRPTSPMVAAEGSPLGNHTHVTTTSHPTHAVITSTLPPTRSLSGSPPRTVFRYRSPSSPCNASAVTSSTTDTVGKADAASAAAVATPMSVTRRLVHSPVVFLEQLMTSHQAQLQQSATTSPPARPADGGVQDVDAHNVRRGDMAGGGRAIPAFLVSPSVSRAREEVLRNEANAVRWQWLVDFRERAGASRGSRSKHEGMMDAFRRQQVPCTSAMLPSGDFMLAVDLTPAEADGLRHASSLDPPLSAQTDHSPAFTHVCSLIVERKTAADLDASVKGTRYSEQRRLLASAPYALVIWLIEGTDAGGRGPGPHSFFARSHMRLQHGTHSASRSPSPVPDECDGTTTTLQASSLSSAESARQRVDSACASLGLQHGGWLVVRTRNTAESVQFLKQLAGHVARQLGAHRLLRRTGSSPASCAGPCAVSPPPQAAKAPSDAQVDGLFCRLSLDMCGGASGQTCDGNIAFPASTPFAFLQFALTRDCLERVGALQRRLRAQTAFPRMLMCVRGCSPSLAALLWGKYGSLIGFWRALRSGGREACDADPDICRLSTAQKKVFILLTEFLLARDYY